jgi:hypothetical protein
MSQMGELKRRRVFCTLVCLASRPLLRGAVCSVSVGVDEGSSVEVDGRQAYRIQKAVSFAYTRAAAR